MRPPAQHRVWFFEEHLMVRTGFASLCIIFVATVPGFAADERVAAATAANTPPAVNLHPVPPARGSILPALYVSAAALQVYDGLSTMNGVKHGAVEANPVMSGMAGKCLALWAVKGGVTTVSIYAAERMWRQD